MIMANLERKVWPLDFEHANGSHFSPFLGVLSLAPEISPLCSTWVQILNNRFRESSSALFCRWKGQTI